MIPVILIVVPGCYIGWEKYNESRIINTDYVLRTGHCRITSTAAQRILHFLRTQKTGCSK